MEPQEQIKKNASTNPPEQPVAPSETKKRSLKPPFIAGILVLVIASGIAAYLMTRVPEATTYDECIATKGSIILEKYPAVCISKHGKEFIQPISPTPSPTIEASPPPTFQSLTIEQQAKVTELKQACTTTKGTWIDEYYECEQMTKDQCEAMGNIFQECTSACRHTNADFCIEVCVPVCSVSLQ
jgi:hypothetical protein